MSALVWCACACTLLAAATARRYERCDLARDLLRHGVQYDHLATWVCIAYHESRYDTAAINPHSHDYGILQISELFWCGSSGANVCGVPCSDFVDDDIADDVRCALRIYREHTALQGDGFLAWVAYSSCREHHVKKFLADCGDVRKNLTSDAAARRALTTLRPPTPAALNASYVKNVDQLKPPDFSGRALPGYYDYKQGRVPKMQRIDSEVSNPLKFNIDDLRLPVFNQIPSSTRKSSYTTTTAPEKSSEYTTYRPSTRKIVTLPPATGGTTLTLAPTSTSAEPPTASPYSASTERATDRTTAQNMVTFPAFSSTSSPTTTTPTTERTTYRPATRKIMTFPTTTTTRPTAASTTSTTKRPFLTWPWFSTSERSISASGRVTTAPWRTADGGASTEATSTTPRPVSSSTSVFDLYLHPKRPSPVTYSFAPFTGKRYRYQIFPGGSTTPYTPLYGKYVDLDVLKHLPGEEDASRHNRFLEERDQPSSASAASAARDYRSVRAR